LKLFSITHINTKTYTVLTDHTRELINYQNGFAVRTENGFN